MKKLASLRETLLNARGRTAGVYDWKYLRTFAEQGMVEFFYDPNDRSFTKHYKANVIAVDFTGDADALFMLILEWLQANQPDYDEKQAMRFHVDIINHRKADVSILLDLSEDTRVSDVEGGVDISILDDPDIFKMPEPEVTIPDTGA